MPRGSEPCPPGCTCGKHRRTLDHNQKIATVNNIRGRAVNQFNIENAPDEKQCSRCKQIKPIGEFKKKKRRRPNGEMRYWIETRCHECFKEVRRDEYRANPEAQRKALERSKKHREESRRDPEKAARMRERNREAATVHRRKKGIPSRGLNGYRKDRERVSREPFIEFLADYMDKNKLNKADISSLVGMDFSAYKRLLEGKDSQGRLIKQVRLATVDSVLTNLGYPELVNELYPLD